MNFTRDPLIETIITPKEGFKLVIRSSKGGAQEEFFVDSVEVISFGKHCFYRSLEKPKSFVVPVGDYEILEVREARMTLKTPTLDKGIKIAGGKEKTSKAEAPPLAGVEVAAKEEQKEKRREKRRTRKRKEKVEQEEAKEEIEVDVDTPIEIEKRPSLIPPPPTLIHEKKEQKTESAPEKKETPEKKSKGASEDSSEGENPKPKEEDSDQVELPF